MTEPMTERQKYAAAKAQVDAIKGFYIHAIVFVAVMTGLAGLDFAKGDTYWVQWPLIGWGLGLAAHAYFVFSPKKPAAESWEERKIKDLMDKM